jgi:predicted PurR-regulated permease PerM
MIDFKDISKNSAYKFVLVGLLIALGLVIFNFGSFYLSGFLGAATLYVILNRQQKYLTQKLKFRRSTSALLLVLEAFILFLIPLTGIALMVIDTLSGISIDPEAILVQINDFAATIEDRFDINILSTENLAVLPRMGTNILQALGSGIYSFAINTVVILFVLYYMLYNNDSLEKAIKEVLPFKEENKQILAEETHLIIQANAIGIPLLAMIQGLFAYFGYIFFGVDNALLFAILTAFVSIIPMVGTMLVWVPLSVGMILGGDHLNGIFLGVYGFFIIGGVDNVARFLLQKRLADIHPLITVFGVLIGIPMFGFWGVIFGPLVLSLFILFVNMYRHEYVSGSTAEPRVTTRYKGEEVKLFRNLFMKKKKKNTEVEDVVEESAEAKE